MTGRLVLTVGNPMMGDDAAGALLARLLTEAPIPGWEVLNGGSAPENVLYSVRELEPQEVWVIDAADMDLEAGEVRLIPAARLGDPFIMTTHSLPLSYLVEALREFVPKVELLGIQPRLVSFGYPLSAEVKDTVQRVYESLKEGRLDWAELKIEGEA